MVAKGVSKSTLDYLTVIPSANTCGRLITTTTSGSEERLQGDLHQLSVELSKSFILFPTERRKKFGEGQTRKFRNFFFKSLPAADVLETTSRIPVSDTLEMMSVNEVMSFDDETFVD